MSEIVSRLRAPLEIEYAVPFPVCEVIQRAADERGEAAAEIERLREIIASGSVCMSPQERVRWIDRARAEMDRWEEAQAPSSPSLP